jgi:hypothetical protein
MMRVCLVMRRPAPSASSNAKLIDERNAPDGVVGDGSICGEPWSASSQKWNRTSQWFWRGSRSDVATGDISRVGFGVKARAVPATRSSSPRVMLRWSHACSRPPPVPWTDCIPPPSSRRGGQGRRDRTQSWDSSLVRSTLSIVSVTHHWPR